MLRKLRRILWLAGIAACLGVGAAVMAQPVLAQTAMQSKGGVQGQKGHVFSQNADIEGANRDMEIAVELAWLGDPISFRFYLEARVVGSAMQIKGYVPSKAIRDHVAGVAKLHCSLPVADLMKEHAGLAMNTPRRPVEQLHGAAESVLQEAFPNQKFLVHCEPDGNVQIAGAVTDLDQKLAVSKALRRLHGCTCVTNLTQVGVAVIAREHVARAPVPSLAPAVPIRTASVPAPTPPTPQTIAQAAPVPVPPSSWPPVHAVPVPAPQVAAPPAPTPVVPSPSVPSPSVAIPEVTIPQVPTPPVRTPQAPTPPVWTPQVPTPPMPPAAVKSPAASPSIRPAAQKTATSAAPVVQARPNPTTVPPVTVHAVPEAVVLPPSAGVPNMPIVDVEPTPTVGGTKQPASWVPAPTPPPAMPKITTVDTPRQPRSEVPKIVEVIPPAPTFPAAMRTTPSKVAPTSQPLPRQVLPTQARTGEAYETRGVVVLAMEEEPAAKSPAPAAKAPTIKTAASPRPTAPAASATLPKIQTTSARPTQAPRPDVPAPSANVVNASATKYVSSSPNAASLSQVKKLVEAALPGVRDIQVVNDEGGRVRIELRPGPRDDHAKLAERIFSIRELDPFAERVHLYFLPPSEK